MHQPLKPLCALPAALAAAFLLAGCSSSPPPAPAAVAVRGKVVVDYRPPWLNSNVGDDLSDGQQVVVVNSAGAVVGSGILTGLVTKNEATGNMQDAFRFSLSVPGGLARYGIQVNGTGHGTKWETPAEMRSGPALEIDETGDGS